MIKKEIIQLYKEAKTRAIAETIKVALQARQRARSTKLKGKPVKFMRYWSNARGGEVVEPSDWPVCYFRYAPVEQSITLRFKEAHAWYNEHSMGHYYREDYGWDKRERRDKTFRESTHQYVLGQIGEVVESLQDRGFNLEEVLYKISGGN